MKTMMNKIKKVKNLIVVYSVKGGCGKTTVALALSQYFGKKNPGRVCYIDTDIVGVGTIALVEEKNKKEKKSITDFLKLNPFDDPDFFKIDFMDPVPDEFYKYIYAEDVADAKDNANMRYFKAIFSSLDDDSRKRAVQTSCDLFFAEDIKGRIKTLLKILYSDSIDTIILDTSPGIQGLTEIVINIAKEFKPKPMAEDDKEKINKEKINVIEVILSTINFAHLNGLMEYIKNYKTQDENNSNNFPGVLLVLNQVPLGVEFKTIPDPNLKYEMKDLYEIKEDDQRVEEFTRNLDLSGERKNKTDIHNAFIDYYTVRNETYLSGCFEFFGRFNNTKDINKRVVVVPEARDIRLHASHFGQVNGFYPGKFFKTLEIANEKGHIGLLGKRIDEIIENEG